MLQILFIPISARFRKIMVAAMNLIKQKSKEKLLKEAKKLRKQMKKDVESAKLIREDRNAR
jgi:hypothetical protein